MTTPPKPIEDTPNFYRPAPKAVSGGEPGIPSFDAGGAKMEDRATDHPGRSSEALAYVNAKSEQATNTIPREDTQAIPADIRKIAGDLSFEFAVASLEEPAEQEIDEAIMSGVPEHPGNSVIVHRHTEINLPIIEDVGSGA